MSSHEIMQGIVKARCERVLRLEEVITGADAEESPVGVAKASAGSGVALTDHDEDATDQGGLDSWILISSQDSHVCWGR